MYLYVHARAADSSAQLRPVLPGHTSFLFLFRSWSGVGHRTAVQLAMEDDAMSQTLYVESVSFLASASLR